jgi:hypothetical protein
MSDSNAADLAYHHAEIARLNDAIAASRPDSSRTNALRTKLKYHEDRIGRPGAITRQTQTHF